MKKVGVITIVDNINFGTYLQAVATFKIIESLGYQAEIIDYIRPYISPKETVKEYLRNKSMLIYRRWIYALFYLILYPYMVWNVKRFLLKNARVTRRYNSYKQLFNNPPVADIFMTGSDQVWNSEYNKGIDKSFFLGFTDKKKVSYGASIGLNNFRYGDIDELHSLISQYSNVSVRESFGIDALLKIGINNVDLVLDPTLLLSKEQWMSIAAGKKFFKSEDYLLIYSVEVSKNKTVLSLAKKIAKEKELKIYWVCPTYKFKSKLKGVDKIYNFASVDLFLHLMANASFVIASSFHGTAFAINFEKQFFSVSPGKFNTRINSLLKICNLENRCVVNHLISSQEVVDVDYCKVASILSEYKKQSFLYLKKALG